MAKAKAKPASKTPPSRKKPGTPPTPPKIHPLAADIQLGIKSIASVARATSKNATAINDLGTIVREEGKLTRDAVKHHTDTRPSIWLNPLVILVALVLTTLIIWAYRDMKSAQGSSGGSVDNVVKAIHDGFADVKKSLVPEKTGDDKPAEKQAEKPAEKPKKPVTEKPALEKSDAEPDPDEPIKPTSLLPKKETPASDSTELVKALRAMHDEDRNDAAKRNQALLEHIDGLAAAKAAPGAKSAEPETATRLERVVPKYFTGRREVLGRYGPGTKTLEWFDSTDPKSYKEETVDADCKFTFHTAEVDGSKITVIKSDVQKK